MLPPDLVNPEERPQYEMVMERARTSGTPFLSLFKPPEILAMARAAGFLEARHVSGENLTTRYFQNRQDGLRPGSGEEFLIATT